MYKKSPIKIFDHEKFSFDELYAVGRMCLTQFPCMRFLFFHFLLS